MRWSSPSVRVLVYQNRLCSVHAWRQSLNAKVLQLANRAERVETTHLAVPVFRSFGTMLQILCGPHNLAGPIGDLAVLVTDFQRVRRRHEKVDIDVLGCAIALVFEREPQNYPRPFCKARTFRGDPDLGARATSTDFAGYLRFLLWMARLSFAEFKLSLADSALAPRRERFVSRTRVP